VLNILYHMLYRQYINLRHMLTGCMCFACSVISLKCNNPLVTVSHIQLSLLNFEVDLFKWIAMSIAEKVMCKALFLNECLHLNTGFSWFPCVYKQMLRWFPIFQVATTCFSCNPPCLFISNQFRILYRCKITTAIG